MAKRPCLDCRTPTTGTRCHPCQLAHQRQQYAASPARQARSTHAYRQHRTQVVDAQRCWLCGEPFTPTDPPTADHLDPLDNGGHILGPILPAHRSCNSSRGHRGNTNPPPPDQRA